MSSICTFCSILLYSVCLFFFFFKQKTAYEMRISDWSSDVCSSDLLDATFLSDNSACDAQRAALAGVRDNPAATPLARELAGDLITLSCLSTIGTTVDGDYSDRQSDNEWSGTLFLISKPVAPLFTYSSASKGYPAGVYKPNRTGVN